MSATHFMAVMLIGVIVANILKEYFSKISETFILIGVGLLISFLPGFRHFELEPDFFMMMIIAPLMFFEGSKISLKSVRKNIKGIFFLSITLAIITVLLVAFLTSHIMNSWIFALAICFAAIVTPTDSAAVKSIIAGKEMPVGVNEAVEFESLFNDATGLVLLSLGLSVLESGHFNLWQGIGQFAFVAIGGIVIGLIAGSILIRIRMGINLRATRPEATIIPISLLTPFFIYLLAEHLGTSGILAVVAAGLVHNFEADVLKLTSTNVQLTNQTIWEIISDMLNNFVFILLGVSLVGIAEILWNLGLMRALTLFLVSVLVYLLMLFIRKFWTYKRGVQALDHFFSDDRDVRSKETTVFALSGAHGTVTLAMAFSLPINSAIISTQNRELMITMAAIVIVLSLVVPTLILPRLLPAARSQNHSNINDMREAMVDFAIINMSQKDMTPQIRNSLIKQLQSQKGLQIPDHKKSQVLMDQIIQEQTDFLKSDAVTAHFSARAIEYFSEYFIGRKRGPLFRFKKRKKRTYETENVDYNELVLLRDDLMGLEKNLYEHSMQTLEELEKTRLAQKEMEFSDIEEVKRILESRHHRTRNEIQEDAQIPEELLIEAFQLEYQFIIEKVNDGSISKELSNKLFKEINNAQVLQLQRES